MPDLKAFAQEIQTYIKPTTLPLAIKLLTSEGEIPENLSGRGIARRTGWAFALGKEDLSCPLSQISRGFGMVQDFEMAFAIPHMQIDKSVTGLQGTHKGGVRYPILFFINWEATFPPKYVELERLWKEGKE